MSHPFRLPVATHLRIRAPWALSAGFLFLGAWCAAFPHLALASEQVGTLTQTEGDVKIFTHPSKTPHSQVLAGTSRALFEGEYFLVRDGKIGDKLEEGNILRTPPAGKARVVFNNGDQFNVGPGSSYRVHWEQDATKSRTQIHLMYGKLRGVIAKGGPRSNLMVRTKSATMGVRGTDFYIADDGGENGTEVSLLRGSVEVTPAVPQAKPIEVTPGFSAVVTPPPPPPATRKDPAEKSSPPPAPVVEVRKTSQQELVVIQKHSQLKRLKEEDLRKVAPPEVLQAVKKLETQAVATVIQDVKTSDPKLYAQLQQKKVRNPEDVNTLAVQAIFKEAPKAPPRRKATRSELEDLENGAYEKYFQLNE